METFKMPPVTIGKAVVGTIIALLIGFLFPVGLILQFSLLIPMVLVTNLLMPVLFVSSGKIAVGALVFAELASTIFFFGDTIGLMILTASVFPGMIMLGGLSRRAGFFDQLRVGIVVHLIGIITAIAIAYFEFGGDMIAKLVDMLRNEIRNIPDEFLMPVVDSVNQMMASMAGGELPAEYMATVDSYKDIMTGTALNLMQDMYAETLPANLLTGAVITGIISVLWGNWRMARKGLATTESFVGMSGWNLPPYICGGIFFLWISVFVIANTGSFSAGQTAYNAVYNLVVVAFYVQALAGFDRMLIARYTGLRARRIIIILLLIGTMIIPIISVIMFVYGGGSAVVILVRSAIAAFKRETDDDDNDNEDMY